jgi:hypothetical protein
MSIAIIYLGIVFIVAACHRFFLKKDRLEEMERFKLPKYFDILIYSFEFIVGAVLLSSCPFFIKKIFLVLLLLFLLIGCSLMLFYHYPQLFKTYTEVFTFQPTCMSYFMHVAYIVMIISVMM